MHRWNWATTATLLLALGCADGPAPTAPDAAPARAAIQGWTRIRLPLQDATAINDKGMIVGYLKNVGAWWYNGTLTQLPRPAQPYTIYWAFGLSEKGQVVGAKFGGNSANYRGLYWATPSTNPVDVGDLGGVSTQAMDVNSSSTVVGVSRASNGQWHAFAWDPTTGIRDLHPAGYLSSTALRVNEKGYIVGFADSPGPMVHRDGIRWDPDGTVNVIQSSTNTIESGLYGLNRLGDASGQNPSFGATIYFFDGTVQFVGGPLGVKSARSITDLYRVVGYWINGSNQTKPWTSRKGQETQLPLLANESGTAADVNSCGLVVGMSMFGTTYAGTLWKPSVCD